MTHTKRSPAAVSLQHEISANLRPPSKHNSALSETIHYRAQVFFVGGGGNPGITERILVGQ